MDGDDIPYSSFISIHAPVKGATAAVKDDADEEEFQSTLP